MIPPRMTRFCDSTMRHRAASSGFTIVELLVVLGIISVLVAILMPALIKARESARRVQCASNMRQMGVIFQMYDNDNKELPPGNWDDAFIIRGSVHQILRDRYKLVEALTICPSAGRDYKGNSPYPSDATYFRRWNQN